MFVSLFSVWKNSKRGATERQIDESEIIKQKIGISTPLGHRQGPHFQFLTAPPLERPLPWVFQLFKHFTSPCLTPYPLKRPLKSFSSHSNISCVENFDLFRILKNFVNEKLRFIAKSLEFPLQASRTFVHINCWSCLVQETIRLNVISLRTELSFK